MEKEFTVEPICIKYICDNCNEGEMRPTGINDWESSPPKFQHKCTECGAEKTFEEKYPLIRYKSIEWGEFYEKFHK